MTGQRPAGRRAVRRRRCGRLVVAGLVVAALAGCQQSPPWVNRLFGDVLPAETLAVSATEGLPLATADLPPLHGGLAPDPHVWLDPRLATAQVERIGAALASTTPSSSRSP